MDWKIFEDPINASLATGGITFILSALLLCKIKPGVVRDDKESKESIDKFKLTLLSTMIAAAVSICVFLMLYKGGATMGFRGHSNSLSY
jgi:hypothetical protein